MDLKELFTQQNAEQTTDEYLNSNFNFQEDEHTRYLKTTTGQALPYKLFSPNDSETRSDLLWRKEDRGSDTDYSLVERQFTENNYLSFTAGAKINSPSDVAWLFKALEDEAIEHFFVLYRFEDGGYFVQHVSSGNIDSAMVDCRVVMGTAMKLKPKSITIVHNHPSGKLKASNPDKNLLLTFKRFFADTDIIVENGLIINLRSGKYLWFDTSFDLDVEHRTGQDQEQMKIQAYSFSKQSFVKNYAPETIKNSHDIAEFISTQKFGVSDKTEMLILNRQLDIVGKVILPPENQVYKIAELLSIYGGVSGILYGNNVNAEMVNQYNRILKNANFRIEDGILIKSDNAEKVYKSLADEGLIREPIRRLDSGLYKDSLDMFMVGKKENEPEQKFTLGRLATVTENERFVKGIITAVDHDHITLQTLNGEDYTFNKEKVHQFFPGQKYDIQEVRDLFKKQLGGISFGDLNEKDIKNLMRGNLSETVFKGHSATKDMDYEFKFRPEYDKEKGTLKMKPYFKNDKEELIYGQKPTESEWSRLRNNEKVIFERIGKSGKTFHVKFSYDPELNRLIPEKLSKKELESFSVKYKKNQQTL